MKQSNKTSKTLKKINTSTERAQPERAAIMMLWDQSKFEDWVEQWNTENPNSDWEDVFFDELNDLFGDRFPFLTESSIFNPDQFQFWIAAAADYLSSESKRKKTTASSRRKGGK